MDIFEEDADISSITRRVIQYLEYSNVISFPSMITYPDFCREILKVASSRASGKAEPDVSDVAVGRLLEFFRESEVLEVSTIITYPDFVEKMLVYSFAEPG